MTEMEKRLNNIVWNRFVCKPWGFILDYADENGCCRLPTPEECERGFPNPLSWVTPLSNGTFYTALYCAALLKRREKADNAYYKNLTDTLIRWLFRAQDVGKNEGFIARGVADDGISHYPFSSDDQFAPWLYTMWHIYTFKEQQEIDKNEIKERMLRAIEGVINAEWSVPSDDARFIIRKRSLLSAQYRRNALCVFMMRIRYELTGNEDYLKSYKNFLNEYPENTFLNRLELLEAGFSTDMINIKSLNQFWITVVYHLMAIDIRDLENGENYERIQRGLISNSITALNFASKYKSFLETEKQLFTTDWPSYLSDIARETNTMAEAQALGNECHAKAAVYCPERKRESPIQETASALWIALTCGHEKIHAYACALLKEFLNDIPWEDLYMAYAFWAECDLYYQ